MSYTRKVALPITSAGVAYVGSKMLYGNVGINTPYGGLSLAAVMAAGAGLGMALSEFSHDFIFKHLHVSERLAAPSTVAVNSGINFGSQLAIAGMLNNEAFAEVDKVKLLAESLGVVVVSDFLYNNFIGPTLLGDDSHATY